MGGLKRTTVLVAVMIGVGLTALFVSQRLSEPDIVLLLPEEGAQWIRFDRPVNLVASRAPTTTTIFRKRFVIAEERGAGQLTVRTFRHATVELDGRPVFSGPDDLARWKTPMTVTLGRLAPGTHELRIIASNRHGPAAVLAFSETLRLVTDENWEASQDGVRWSPAVSVERFRPPDLSREFPPVSRAFQAALPVFVPVFLLVFVATLVGARERAWFGVRMVAPSPSQIRWFVMICWGVLAVNNIAKVPPYIGFDARDHLEYVQYIVRTGGVPLATEGWQMFQSPLYYLLSAPFYAVAQRYLEPESMIPLLRVIPLVSGLAQVELCYRALRAVYPQRPHLQALGTVIGGLLPMNIYMAQSLGNEPLAGALSALAIALALSLTNDSMERPSPRVLILLGGALGLALLTKVSALLLLPPIILLVLIRGRAVGRPIRRALGDAGIVVGIVVIVCGWYYVRNWVELGKPFIGGWDQSRTIVWWQDPGYRTLRQLWAFGESLRYPVYAALSGFWDSVYSSLWLDSFLGSMTQDRFKPPWNYDLMLSGAWLGIIPTLGILIGVVTVLRRRPEAGRSAGAFAIACLVMFYAAMLALYVSVPIYSTAKASYTLGLAPCYALLGARGLDVLIRGPVSRALVYAGVACWASGAYLAYFVR